jgi:hypothetical protein
MPSMAAFGSNESCPNCNARMAADQRYCLNCGHRRGEPRLPFMDAVVFMESMNQPGGGTGAPPPPPSQQSGGGSNNRWNANAALIAGVATLVLAIGVGFLIGRTGHNDNSSQAQAPQIIKVEGGGGGGEQSAPATPEETETTGGSGTATKGGKANKGGGKEPAIKAEGNKATPKAEKNSQKGAHGQTEGVEKALHTSNGVELAEPEQELGGACKEGQAGCEGGKFNGTFFGE